MYEINNLPIDDYSMEAHHKKAIEEFKKSIIEDVKEVEEAWKQGYNRMIRQYSDLRMVDHYVEYHNANREELEQYILEAFRKIKID